MYTSLLNPIYKEAGLGSSLKSIWKSSPASATRGVLGKGLNVLFGAMTGAVLGNRLADVLEKGPVGSESKARWEAELEARHRNNVPVAVREEANKAVGRGNLLGAIAGTALALPFAFKGGGGLAKKILMPAGGAILGKSILGGYAKKRHPAYSYQPSAIDAVMSQYGNLFTPEQRSEWMDIRNSPEVRKNPRIQARIARSIESLAKTHPEAKKFRSKSKIHGTIGKILGGGAILATMIYGKNKRYGDKLIKGILGKPGGFMSRNPFKTLAGLELASMGTGLLGSYTGAKRAKLTPKQTRRHMGRQVTTGDTGMELFFGGSMLG